MPLSDSYTDYAGLVPAHVPTSMSGGSNSGSVRDDYDNPEDLWEDNQDWYEDEDEAWDEWENGQEAILWIYNEQKNCYPAWQTALIR